MKKIILPIYLLFNILIVHSQVEFSANKFSDAKKMHKKIVEISPELFVKHNVEHLQIIECIADVTVDNQKLNLKFTSQDEFEKYYKNKHSEYSKLIGESYFENALDVIYNRFNKMLSDNGLFPTEKESVVTNETFIKHNLNKEINQIYDGSVIASEAKSLVSTSGMNPLPTDLDYNAKEDFNQELAKIANDNEADAALKIHIGISIDSEGVITLTKYDVRMDTWLTAYRKGNETKYKWKVIDTALFKLKNEIKGSESHSNLDSLDEELINIFDSVTEMYSYSLSSYL